MKKIASPTRSQKGLELQYQRQLAKLGKELVAAIRSELLIYLKANQESYVIDGVGDQLGVIFRRLNAQFAGTITAGFAQSTASQMVQRVGASNKRRFDRTVHAATGVDLGSVIASEGLEDFVALSVNKNVSLIKSLPEQYLGQVETIINNGVASGARYSTIEKQITTKTGANGKLANRIKTIARNEVQTINSQITLRRSESLGITKGMYRTSEDERVRPCHSELNGVEFEIKKGAWSKKCQKFIQPGITDINCRCSYSPIIKFGEEEEAKPVKKSAPKKVAAKKIEPKKKERTEFVSKGVLLTEEVEEEIRNKKFEEVHIISSNGEKISTKKGTERNVSASPDDIKKMKNNIVTHNHPFQEGSEGRARGDGGSFSPGDIELLFESGAREMRAVSQKFNHSLKIESFGIKMPKNPAAKVQVTWEKNADIELKKFRKESGRASAVLTEADREVWHTIMENTASKFKWLNYKREAKKEVPKKVAPKVEQKPSAEKIKTPTKESIQSDIGISR